MHPYKLPTSWDITLALIEALPSGFTGIVCFSPRPGGLPLFAYYEKGVLHRTDGPAVLDETARYFFIDGTYRSKVEFLRRSTSLGRIIYQGAI